MAELRSKPCPRCGGVKLLEVTEEELALFRTGSVVIQKAFPRMSRDDRERLLSGYCPECWDILFPE